MQALLRQIEIFKRLLSKFNAVHNLTKFSSIDEQIADSIAPLLAGGGGVSFSRGVGECAGGVGVGGDFSGDFSQSCGEIFARARRGVDVGSGAGFPAIFLALKTPHICWSLFEPNAKKSAFLTLVKQELGLENVRVFTKKVQDVAPCELAWGGADVGENPSANSREISQNGTGKNLREILPNSNLGGENGAQNHAPIQSNSNLTAPVAPAAPAAPNSSPQGRFFADIITSRALASAAQIVSLTAHLRGPDTAFLLYKGSNAAREAADIACEKKSVRKGANHRIYLFLKGIK